MRLFTLLALFVATATSVAQSPATSAAVAIAPPSGQNCPVDFDASRLPDGDIAMANSGPTPHGQPLHLSFRPTGKPGVAQAEITVHGMSGHHVIPAGKAPGPDTTEDFSVSPTSGGNRLYSSVVYVRKLTAVDWIELNSITFADGTRWRASDTSTCRVAPKLFQLVAAGK